MRFRKITSIIITVLLLCFSFFTQAQCAMCKGSVQKSQYAKSINDGIEYLLMAPIILVTVIAFIWIKNKDKFHTQES